MKNMYSKTQIRNLAKDYLSGDNKELEYTFSGYDSDIKLRDKRIEELEEMTDIAHEALHDVLSCGELLLAGESIARRGLGLTEELKK